MSRWKTIVSVAGLAVLGLAVAATTNAAGRGRRGPGFGPGRDGPVWHDLRLLDLTQEQMAAVRDLLQEHREAVKPLRERQRALRLQIDELAASAGADPAQLGQMVIEAHAGRQQLRERMESLQESVAALLTPEQRAFWDKLKSARERARTRDGARRGPGRNVGPGRGLGPCPGGGFFGFDDGPGW